MTITDKLQKNHADFSRKVEEVRGDWTRSDEAKRQDLQTAYEEAKTTHARLEDEYRKGINERLEKARSTAFAAPKVGKDPALDLLVYRDALDRTSKTRDPRELTDTLTRARTTGDAALAKAVLFRGYELENPNLVGAYFEKYPEERPAWGEFMQAAEAHNTLEALGTSGAVGVPEPERPQELGAQRSHEQSWRPFAYSATAGEDSGESSAGGAK
jgi:hypothetical protein